jgi:hypothetical protein
MYSHSSSLISSSIDFKTNRDGIGAQAQFRNLARVVLDGSGNYLVSEPINQALRLVTPTGHVRTIAVGISFYSLQYDRNANVLYVGTEYAEPIYRIPLDRIPTSGVLPLDSSHIHAVITNRRAVGMVADPQGNLYLAGGWHSGSIFTLSTCSAGTFMNASGHCTTCPALSTSLDFSYACHCRAGSSSTNRGYAPCSACPAGSFSSTPGSTTCRSCPGNHFYSVTIHILLTSILNIYEHASWYNVSRWIYIFECLYLERHHRHCSRFQWCLASTYGRQWEPDCD